MQPKISLSFLDIVSLQTSLIISGPGFPPYDGIFGSPFGPGGFPPNQSPFPKGTGTPMDPGPLPIPPIPYGQPPLTPTGRRSNGKNNILSCLTFLTRREHKT